jgi:sec-independent protein translocase protein TatB
VLNSIGWGEIVVLGLAALFIFGPERLPDLAKDAAGGLERVRGAVAGVRGQLHETLGDDFDHLRDVDLRRYHPRTFLREHLIDDAPGPAHRTGP